MGGLGKEWGGLGKEAGGQGRAGRGGGGGACRSHGNVGIVSEKLQTFRSKERARKEFVGKEWGGLGKDWGGLGKDCILWIKANFRGQKKMHHLSATVPRCQCHIIVPDKTKCRCGSGGQDSCNWSLQAPLALLLLPGQGRTMQQPCAGWPGTTWQVWSGKLLFCSL